MEELGETASEVNARIVYWGVDGAGKQTNLRVIHQKLRPDHRGELRTVPTRLDPTVTSLMLPIELGDVSGVRTRIQVWTAPSGPEQGPSRQQVLDEVDGIVFVVDTSGGRIDDNLASFEELRSALRAYGREVEEIPLVIQYNKRDVGDPYALEELHRKLHMRGAAAFEAVATEGTAVLQTLTTISKRVIRHLRESARSAAAAGSAEQQASPEPAPPQGVTQILDGMAPSPELDLVEPDIEVGAPLPASSGLDAEPLASTVPGMALGGSDPDFELSRAAQSLFEPGFQEEVASTAYDAPDAHVDTETWENVEIASVGVAERADARTVRVPVTLRDERGRELRVSLSVRIDTEDPDRA